MTVQKSTLAAKKLSNELNPADMMTKAQNGTFGRIQRNAAVAIAQFTEKSNAFLKVYDKKHRMGDISIDDVKDVQNLFPFLSEINELVMSTYSEAEFCGFYRKISGVLSAASSYDDCELITEIALVALMFVDASNPFLEFASFVKQERHLISVDDQIMIASEYAQVFEAAGCTTIGMSMDGYHLGSLYEEYMNFGDIAGKLQIDAKEKMDVIEKQEKNTRFGFVENDMFDDRHIVHKRAGVIGVNVLTEADLNDPVYD